MIDIGSKVKVKPDYLDWTELEFDTVYIVRDVKRYTDGQPTKVFLENEFEAIFPEIVFEEVN